MDPASRYFDAHVNRLVLQPVIPSDVIVMVFAAKK